jgi:hypothetical protein
LSSTSEDWLPPRIPSGSSFKGKITYVDDEAQFYIQPNWKLAEMIGTILTEKYETTTCSADSMFWEEGDMVISAIF